MPDKSLIIGYGNPYRRDDGIAFHVINAVRRTQGQGPLGLDEDGQDDWGHTIDTLMQHQLLPELAPLLAGYQKVIFVDAHTEAFPEPLRIVAVEAEYGFHAVTHHVSPAMLLYLVRAAGGNAPTGWLVSLRGYDFDFGDELSPLCAEALPQAVDRILALCQP